MVEDDNDIANGTASISVTSPFLDDKTISATEIDNDVVLILMSFGYGSVFPTNNTVYPKNSTITVTGLPADGYRFENWTGDIPNNVDATLPSISVTLFNNAILTANFTLKTNRVSAVIDGVGSVTDDGIHTQGSVVILSHTRN